MLKNKAIIYKVFPAALIVGAIVLIFSCFLKNNKGSLKLQIKTNPVIMPAAYKVYSNSELLGGKYFLFKALLTNDFNKTLNNVVVKYSIPGFVDWTVIGSFGKINPGQNVTIACYPKFDKSIVERNTRSKENFILNISWDGASKNEIIERNYSFDLLSVNEIAYTSIDNDEITSYADLFDNKELFACWVTPNDPIIQLYTSLIQSEILKGEKAAVTKTVDDAILVLYGIYEMTKKTNMVYSSTKGIPSEIKGIETTIQNLRLPREVIVGNTGLCIELSLLYASVISKIGLNPIIFLQPGHAFPGIEIDGNYYAIEATMIGGEGLGYSGSFEEALQTGMDNLKSFFEEYFYQGQGFILKINELQEIGILPMELKDDQYSKSLFEDRFKNKNNFNNKINHIENNNKNSFSNNNRFNGRFSVMIPNGWNTFYYPYQNFPSLTAIIVSPDNNIVINIFDIPANSVNNAMVLLYNEFYRNGVVFEYNINGQQASGYTYSSLANTQWVGKIGNVDGGYRLICISSNVNSFKNYYTIINEIYNSIK